MAEVSRRMQFQEKLKTLCDNVYFQPPEDVKMTYPCIVYEPNPADTTFADNHPFSVTDSYQVTVIDEDPDSPIPKQVRLLPMTRHNRSYAAEQLNHTVFTIFF